MKDSMNAPTGNPLEPVAVTAGRHPHDMFEHGDVQPFIHTPGVNEIGNGVDFDEHGRSIRFLQHIDPQNQVPNNRSGGKGIPQDGKHADQEVPGVTHQAPGPGTVRT